MLDDHLVVGLLILGFGAIILYISYTAQSGLPWKASYTIDVQVADAGKLPKNADVRVGGARVGQVLKIEAVPREGKVPPHAQLEVKLDKEGTPLAVDTTAEVRLASVLGSKYLALVPGKSAKTIPAGGVLPLANTSATVDVDQAFQVFGPEGRTAIRSAVTALGDGLAGRGRAVNETVAGLAELMPGFQRVLTTVTAQRTDLDGFVSGAAAATGAIAGVAPELGPFVANAAATFGALDAAGDSLGTSIAEFPSTAVAATRALRNVQPVLDDAAAITRELEPAAAQLPDTTRKLDTALRTAARVDPRAAVLAKPLDDALGAVGSFSANPASLTSLQLLGATDLATFGASAFVGLGAILSTTWDAERYCGTATAWARALRDVLSDGDEGGNWIRMAPLFKLSETFPSAEPAAELHANPYPNQNAQECEAGHEGFGPGQQIGNPPGLQGKPGAAP
jgi:phospholipid/cholesterol/gamma-HCH transport system substrate-binding protein